MSSPIHSRVIEEMIRKISNVPEPKEAFIVSLRERFIRAGQMNAKLSTDNSTKKPIHPLNIRRLVWGLIIVLLIATAILLATSPTVVTALERLLGYIPGVGIVEQGPSLRILEKPVSVEQDGIRMTVEEAVADSTHTVVSFKVEWLNPPSAEGERDTSCDGGYPKLTLANGSLISEGRTTGKNVWESGYSYVMEFSSLTSDKNDAILVYPCIVPIFPGHLPQNWQIPLHFIPSDHLNLAPVVEVPTASSIPTIQTQPAATSQPAQNFGISFVLDKVVELETGYLFMGHVSWNDPSVRPYGVTLTSDYPMKLTDSSGQAIPLEEKTSEASSDEKQTLWAYQSTGKGSGPLTLMVDTMLVDQAIDKASFQFDPGPNPLHNQTWLLNREVEAGGHTIHVLSASLGDDPQVKVLTFTMQSDPAVGMVSLMDMDRPQGGGGGGADLLEPPITSNVYYYEGLPAGALNIAVTDITLKVNGPWQVTWSPK